MGVKRIYNKAVGKPYPTGEYKVWEKIWQGVCYRCGKAWADHHEPNSVSSEAFCYENEDKLKFQ